MLTIYLYFCAIIEQDSQKSDYDSCGVHSFPQIAVGAVFTADLSAGGSGFPFAVDDDVGGSLLGGIGGGSQRGAARAAGGGAWAGDDDAEVEPVEVAVGALVTLLSEAPALGGQAPSSELRGCAIDVSRAASAAGGGAGNGMTFVNVLGRLQVLCDEA